MADRETEEPDGPDARRRELRARREAATTAAPRQVGAGAWSPLGLLIVVGGVVAIVLTSAGGDSGRIRPSESERRRPQAAKKARPQAGSLVRNATPQPDWEPHTGPVPILEYHVLGAAPADAPYPELYVDQARLPPADGLARRPRLPGGDAGTGRGSLVPRRHAAAKPVVVSFDDGYRPQFTFALPELRKHGWPGVLNLKAEGSDLYESNVKAMIAAGWELAAHTIDHLDLTALDAAALKEEVAGSRADPAARIRRPGQELLLPRRPVRPTVIAAVEAAGYTARRPRSPATPRRDAPYELARFEILGSTGVAGLAADLRSRLTARAPARAGPGCRRRRGAPWPRDAVVAVVEDRGAEDGVGAALGDRLARGARARRRRRRRSPAPRPRRRPPGSARCRSRRWCRRGPCWSAAPPPPRARPPPRAQPTASRPSTRLRPPLT